MLLKIKDGDRYTIPTTSIKKRVCFANIRQNRNENKSIANY